MHSLGITSEHFELKIHVSSIKAKILEQTTDHREYIEPTLRDCIKLTDSRYEPMIMDWMNVHQTFVEARHHDGRNEEVQRASKTLQSLRNLFDRIQAKTSKARDLLGVGLATGSATGSATQEGRRRRQSKSSSSSSGSSYIVNQVGAKSRRKRKRAKH